MSNRRSSAASDGGKRQSSLLSFFKVLPKKEEDKPSSSLHCNATDVEMVALPATVESISSATTSTAPVRRSSLVSEELTQVQAKSQPVGRRKRRLTYVDDNSDDDSDDHESGDAIVVPVKRPRGAHYESANSASALDVESYHELTYDTEASPAVPDVLRPRPENTVTLALRRPLESPSGDDYEVTREEIEAKARGWPPYAAACLRAYYETRDTYSYPSWMHPDKLADAKGRRPDHPDYDQSTMRVPDLRDSASRKKEEGHCTPMLLQYWEVKAKHFDEITLFKVGKFYEIFYYDAVFAQAACNLRWMGNNKKPHVGFPEVSLYEYSSILVNAGYRTVVVEQVERVGEMNKGQGRKSDAVVKREACQAHSAGTLTHEVMLKKSPSPAQPKYLMALWFGDASAHPGSLGERLSFGCCVVDCTTSTFKYGWFEDKPDRQLLRTILITLQPRELLADKKSIPTAVHRLVQNLAVPPTVTQWQHWDPDTGLSSKHGNEDEPLPVQRACGAVLAYLRQAMLYEAVTSFATWERLSTSDASSAGLILDANALEQLEVLRNTDGKLEGSLLEHLDHTVTPFGKRMLRQWVCCPMRRKVDIDRRLDVVDWLLERGELVSELRSKMGKLPDIERRQNRVFALGLQMERKAVLYGEVESSRIAQFMELLAALKEADDCLAKVRDGGDKLPALLDELVPVGELGHVDGILDELGSRVQGSEVTGYSPSPGCYPAYDEARSKIASIKSDLQEELKKICNEHLKGCKMQEAKFVSVKYRYEIEVPERCAPRNLEEHGLEVSSTRKGFVRLLSQEIREMTDELEKTEEQMKDCLYPFMAQLFKDFHKHTVRLQDMVQRLATLDCLLSLSEASRPGSGPMCRPEILDSADFPVPILDLQDGRHPVQEAVLARSGREFVANTVEMGVHASPTTLLVTGPNMGGKSTVLRLSATAVIIAQLGCRVPASSFRLTPVDRIFTRIGARDSILENKSTFLIELEETGAVLQHATKDSLAVIDELGRGTSTFDGAAIAHAVLKRISEHIGCRTLFATHYHQLAEDETLLNTGLYHQACLVNPTTREVTFLYKFTEGRCPQSHAMHVAKIAGLPEVIVEEARQMSAVFHSAVKSSAGPSDDEALGNFYDSVKHVAAH